MLPSMLGLQVFGPLHGELERDSFVHAKYRSTLSFTVFCMVHKDLTFFSGRSNIQNRDIQGENFSAYTCHLEWNDYLQEETI